MTLLREPLTDLPEREQQDVGDLAFVGTRLETQSEQTGHAIRAAIVVVNIGDHRIELLNPFDLLQWQLLDDAGAPLDVPTEPPNLAVHRPRSTPWKLGGAVPVLEVRMGGEPTEPIMLDSPTLALAPQVELAVTFEIAEILEDRRTVRLHSGEYHLGCLVTLIDTEQRSRIVGCSPLPVRFEKA